MLTTSVVTRVTSIEFVTCMYNFVSAEISECLKCNMGHFETQVN